MLVLRKPQEDIPNEDKILTIMDDDQTVIIGTTTLKEIRTNLSHHQQLLMQYTDSVEQLEVQEQEAISILPPEESEE